jgi:lipid II isoglutaminyl synthase (glutamine-hydrolysing)
MNYVLNIAWLYPDLMSTYGDRGNVIVLQKRCQWRKIETQVRPVTLETPVKELEKCDLIFMGGAQDRQQKLAGEDFLKRKGPIIKRMVEDGMPALFVCAAYQFVGKYYKPYQGDPILGAGIWDLYTDHPGDQAKRLIGNVVAEIIGIDTGSPSTSSGRLSQTIIGFENHGGRTYLGPKMKPLARVIKGYGNNGEDGFEGATYKNTIGSYFHGPLLPKNPQIADWLIQKALEKKYNKKIILETLDDSLSQKAKQAIIEKIS